MAQPKFIPEELQLRMAALDKRCDIEMRRRTEYATGSGWSSIIVEGDRKKSRRAWYVRITPRDGEADHRIIHVQEPALADAMRLAVEQAEARGLHKPV